MTHTLTIHQYDATDPRLGRHVHHDSRSLGYLFLLKNARPKGKNTFWDSHTEPLNQGNLGSCTGNASAQWMNTTFADKVRAQIKINSNEQKKFSNGFLTELNAVDIYSLGTHIDSYPGAYPPKDTGCDGLSVAKACQQLGYLSGYRHIVSETSAMAADEMTPSIQGTVWTQQMFNPTNGLVKVGKINDSTIAGGHEYLRCGINHTEKVIIYRNSWGDQDKWPGCKPGGYFAMSFRDTAALLAEQGDVTVFTGNV